MISTWKSANVGARHDKASIAHSRGSESLLNAPRPEGKEVGAPCSRASWVNSSVQACTACMLPNILWTLASMRLRASSAKAASVAARTAICT
eukprot:373325-Prymnesium_polylepis.1